VVFGFIFSPHRKRKRKREREREKRRVGKVNALLKARREEEREREKKKNDSLRLVGSVAFGNRAREIGATDRDRDELFLRYTFSPRCCYILGRRVLYT
jgi:hypothetical protein